MEQYKRKPSTVQELLNGIAAFSFPSELAQGDFDVHFVDNTSSRETLDAALQTIKDADILAIDAEFSGVGIDKRKLGQK